MDATEAQVRSQISQSEFFCQYFGKGTGFPPSPFSPVMIIYPMLHTQSSLKLNIVRS